MHRSVALAFLLSSLVSARFFTLRLSLPSSTDHSSFSLCINQIGSSECSLFSSTQIPLDGSTMEMEFVSNTTRSSIQQHISFTSSIISSNFSIPLRRHSSLRLSINQLKSLWIAPGLAMNASLHCQQNYFGAACSIRCVSTDRINCDESGRPSCVNGWTGEGCATSISSTVVTTTVPSTTVLPSTTESSEEVTVDIRPHPDHTQLLIVLCMVLIVTMCAVVLYSMHQMSSVVSTLAAPDRLTTHLTTLDSSMDGDDSSVLFKAACNHLQSMQDLMVRADSDSVLDSSFVSALDEKTYVEMYP